MSGYDDIDPSALGPNMWLVDEMYRRFQEDPDSVDEKWRDFFDGFRPKIGEPVPAGALAEAIEEQAEEAREVAEARSQPIVAVKEPSAGARSVAAERPIGRKEEEKVAPPERPEKGPSRSEGLSQALRAREVKVPEGAERIRFAAERIVKNMQASLEIPTATSFRFIPAKLLAENRR